MKIVAIITEYNLFHNGHARLNRMIRESIPDAVIVAVMSENFVQRGEPAALDKYVRARAAVKSGTDLVLSLPFPFCCSTAECFARGGITIVNSLGCADYLAFGSECGNLETLKTASNNLKDESFRNFLSGEKEKARNSPVSHITSLRSAYMNYFGNELPSGGNDTLAVEYLKKLDSSVTPLAFARNGNESASESRRLLYSNSDSLRNLVPPSAFDEYISARRADRELFASVLTAFFRCADKSALSRYFDCPPDIAALICAAAKKAAAPTELFSLCSSKKYTSARIRRAMLNCFFSLTDKALDTPRYSLLLAANEKGLGAAAKIRRNSSLPVITKPSSYKKAGEEVINAFERSLRAESLYSLLVGEDASKTLKKTPYLQTVK